MRIIIVAHRFHTNLYYRAKTLIDTEHEVMVLVLYKGKSEFYENINIKVFNLSVFSRVFIKTLNLFQKNRLKTQLELRLQNPNKELKKEIKTFNPDVIILKAYQNLLALKTLFYAKRLNIKVLMLTQTTFTHIKGSGFLFGLNIKLFKFLGVHAYLTPIKSNYDAFKNFGINNVFYLPFVFPAATILPYLGSNNTDIKIMSVGKFEKRKDHILLIKVIDGLIKKGYNLKLSIYGEKADDKYFNEINTYIENYSLKGNIYIYMNIDYKTIINEYAKHDIFVLPSYAEPAAYSIVEAMANGLPVICSNQNGTSCYIEQAVNGYVFEAKNSGDLSDKIEILVSDKEKRYEISKNALISAQENHKPENFSKKVSEIIKTQLETNR